MSTDFSHQHTVFPTGWLLKQPCLRTCLQSQHTRFESFDTVTQQRHGSFISFTRSNSAFMFINREDLETYPLGVLGVWVKCVTKGTMAIQACCCANHSSMWSLEIADVQCHRVYSVFVWCFRCRTPPGCPIKPTSCSTRWEQNLSVITTFSPVCNRTETFFYEQTDSVWENSSYTQ